MSRTPPPTTRIGVLFVDTAIQLIDLSPIDIFAMLSESYLSTTSLPAPLKAGAIPLSILYINQAGPGTLQQCTANLTLRVDAAISDEICAPPAPGAEKTLDILLIPGPNPWTYESNDAISGFIKGHFDAGADILTVCTGIYPAGYAGILNGKTVSGPRDFLPELEGKFPGAKWVDKRWVSDGNLWNSGGLSNGQDMVAAYIRTKWPGPTAEGVLTAADVGGRGQEYEGGQ